MAASEAVMVAPEQSATAPKTLAAHHATSAKTSTTRLVLLAVLALAAATGAMFGAVVLGNQLTQELHPKGSSHLNSVTLVDSEDRAIATTAVESYVSLLDLPLLGTAELNKVDGITFSTHRGIEHRKVTGYTVTTETARVGDSEVKTPRLSLATSTPGATVEVSVRDNKAWLNEIEDSRTLATAIDTVSQRRLADGGSCLESGACLYSRDELLRLDAASRRLEEGSFFARADVAAYQVELSGDLLQYLEGASEAGTLDGRYSEDGHQFRLRVEQVSEGTEVLFTNLTSGKSKLITSEGTYLFSAEGRLLQCKTAKGVAGIADLDMDAVAKSIPFDKVEITRSAPAEGFIPFKASTQDCFHLTTKQANLSSPEALQLFPEVAGALQESSKKDIEALKDSLRIGSRRTLAARNLAATEMKGATIKARKEMEAGDLVSLMTNPRSGRAMTMKELVHSDRERVLKAARAKAHSSRELPAAVEITRFDLWVATRMADPLSVTSDFFADAEADDWFEAAAPGYSADYNAALDLSGWHGIRAVFAEWSGFHYFNKVATATGGIGMSTGAQASQALIQSNYPGVCAGAYNKLSVPLPDPILDSTCGGWEEISAAKKDEYVRESEEISIHFRNMYPECAYYFDGTGNCEKNNGAFMDVWDECSAVTMSGCGTQLEAEQLAIQEWAIKEGLLDTAQRKLMQFDLAPSDEIHMQEQELSEISEARKKAYVTKFSASKKSTQSLDYKLFHAALEDEGVFDDVEGSCPTATILKCQEPLIEFTALTTPIPASISHYCEGRRRLGGTKDVDADLGRLLGGEEEADPEPEAELPTGGVTDPPIVLPNAYASILFKTKMPVSASVAPWDAKFVVTFQGTKFSEPSMLMYSMKKSAVYVDMGGGYSTVTTEGFALYVSQTIPCIESMVAYLPNGKTDYITGHSLGGSAATIYADKASFSADLVTFGAQPTAPLDYQPGAVKCEFDWVGLECKPSGYVPPSFQTPTIANSFRYFHKFDPIPGFYFSMGGWKHVAETAYLLYDSTEECSLGLGGVSYDSSYTLADYSAASWPGFDATTVVANIYDMLCDTYDVSPGSWQVAGDPNVYFSYTNAWNPMPCSEALLTMMVDYASSAPGLSTGGFSSTNPAPGTWIMYESFYECSQSYIASLEAYFAIYLASQLSDTYWPTLYDADVTFDDVSFHLYFYGLWGMWWIHSSYPNYDLEATYGPQEFEMITSAEDDYVMSSVSTLETLAEENIPGFVLDVWWNGDYSDLEQKVKDYLEIEEWTDYVPETEDTCEEPSNRCAGWLAYVTDSLIPSGNCYYTWIYTTYVITERRGCAECTVAKGRDAFQADPCNGKK